MKEYFPKIKSLVVIGVILAIMVLIEYKGFSHKNLGFKPRSFQGLWGFITGPFFHIDRNHLIGNLIAFIPLAFISTIVFDAFLGVMIGIWVTNGILFWLFGGSSVIGLSGITCGILGYMSAVGFREKSGKYILLSLGTLAVWFFSSYTIFGGEDSGKVSISSHIIGLIAGGLFAYFQYQELPQE